MTKFNEAYVSALAPHSENLTLADRRNLVKKFRQLGFKLTSELDAIVLTFGKIDPGGRS